MVNLILAAIALTPIVDLPHMSSWQSKMFVSAFFALAFFLKAIQEGTPIKFKNNFALLFMAIIVGEYFLQPNINKGVLPLFNRFEGITFCLCYFLGLIGIASYDLSCNETEKIRTWIACVGGSIATYVILQSFEMDQFFDFRSDTSSAVSAVSAKLFGTLGNSRICGTYLSLTLPFAVMNKNKELKKIMSGLILLALIMIQSKLVWFSLLVAGLLYLTRSKKEMIGMTIVVILLTVTYYQYPHNDSDRLRQWIGAFQTFKSRAFGFQYCISGYGLNSFKAIQQLTGRTWWPMHNEYLEVLWCTGVLGFTAFVGAIACEIKKRWWLNAPEFYAFVISLVSAFWNFSWQIGPIALLTIISVGLMNGFYGRKNN